MKKAEPLETPVSSNTNEAMSKMKVDPFAKISRCPRTPPRKATSLPDLESPQEIEKADTPPQSTKRKRTETASKDEIGDPEIAGRFIKESLGKMRKQIMHLDKVVRGMYKPKQEIKEISEKLLLEIERLRAEEIMEWLEQEPRANTTREVENNLREENLQLKQQLERANKDAPIMQCENCQLYTKRMIRRKTLKKVENFEHFQLVTEDDWNDEVFPKLKVASVPIWEAPADFDVILPCSKDFDSTDKITKGAINRFGGKDGLAKQNKAKGEVATMIHSVGFPDELGNITHTSRRIFYPIVTEGEPWEEAKDETIYKGLSKIKESLTSNSNKKIAIPKHAGIAGVILERIAEYLFADTNVELQLYKANEEKRGYTKRTPSAQGLPNANTYNIRPTSQKKKEQEAVLVKMKGTSYADLLKKLKESVDPEELGVDLNGVKQTRNGDMLLLVKNGMKKAEDLKNKIKEKLPTANTSHVTSKKVIHLKDLDGVTNTEEIREAVSRCLKTEQENIDIRALRPAYGGRQNVTVILKSEDADKLIEMGNIKIGWTNCRIIERKQDTKCHRCWTLGHTKRDCIGPDRTTLCLKCAKPGHKAAECKNPAYCVHCNQEGHQSSNQRCRKFKTPSKSLSHENTAN